MSEGGQDIGPLVSGGGEPTPPQIEWLDDPEPKLLGLLNSHGIRDSQNFLADYVSTGMSGVSGAAREDVVGLALGIMQRKVQAEIEIETPPPSFLVAAMSGFRTMLRSFSPSPETKFVRQLGAAFSPADIDKYVPQLVDLYGEETLKMFDTQAKRVLAVEFMRSLDLAMVVQEIEIAPSVEDPSVEDRIEILDNQPGAVEDGVVASPDAVTASSDLNIEVTPIEPPDYGLGDVDLSDIGANVPASSVAETTVGGEQVSSGVVAQARQLVELRNTLTDLQTTLNSSSDPLSEGALEVSGKMSEVNIQIAELKKQLDKVFGANNPGVFFQVFGDLEASNMDDHQLLLRKKNDLVELAIAYLSGQKGEGDLAGWHQQASQALGGLRQPKITDEALAQLMVGMKQ